MSAAASVRVRSSVVRHTARVIVALILGYLVLVVVVQPSNDRDWAPDQAQLARARFDGERIELDHVRNAHYRSTQDFDVRWESRQFDLRTLDSLWYVVEPFATWRGPAHTFLSFGFSDGRYLAISVEVRRERDESFSPMLGLLRQYELTYIIGDEHDLIGLRANHRKDDVYLYKMRATPQQIRALLLDMLQRANHLAAQPEFYNTLTNTCTSNIVDHIEHIAPGGVPWSYKTYLPAFSDDLAFELGLIDTALSKAHYRSAHRINALAARYSDDPEFSARIRGR
jgi:hypothetical protein